MWPMPGLAAVGPRGSSTMAVGTGRGFETWVLIEGELKAVAGRWCLFFLRSRQHYVMKSGFEIGD